MMRSFLLSLKNEYLRNGSREFLQIWHKQPLGLNEELSRVLVVKVNVSGNALREILLFS